MRWAGHKGAGVGRWREMEPAIDDALVEEALQRAQQQQQQQQPPQPQQQAQQQQPQQQRPPPAPTVDDPDYLALLEQGRRRDWTEFVALDMLCVRRLRSSCAR